MLQCCIVKMHATGLLALNYVIFFVYRSILPTASLISRSLPSTSSEFCASIPSPPFLNSSSEEHATTSFPATSLQTQVAPSLNSSSEEHAPVSAMYLPTSPSSTSYHVVEVQKKVLEAPPPPPPKDSYTIQIEVMVECLVENVTLTTTRAREHVLL